MATSTARAQAWNDGAPSRTQHLCWQGIFPAIPEDLAWVYTGFQGYPRVNETYYVRVVVAGLGCSGMWAIPEIRLPPNTALAIDAAHPIRCYLGNFGAEQPLTDNSCPSSLSSFTTIGGGFIGIPPAIQPYWPVPAGKALRIEVPVKSSTQLFGIGSANDFVLGGAQLLDNSPGNPSPVYNAPPPGYSSGIPSSGAWQGVFVGPAGTASFPTNPQITFAEPSATIQSVSGTNLTVQLAARAYFVDCFCDSNRSPAPGITCQNPYPGSGPESCCFVGGNVQRNVVFTMYPANPAIPDVLVGEGGFAQSVSTEPPSTNVFYSFSAAEYGVEYEYNYAPIPGALYYAAGPQCASTGNPPGSTPPRRVTFADPAAPVTYNLLTNVDGEGSVTLDPAGGVYDPGATVTATATADAGYAFTGWRVGSAASGSTNPYAIAVNSDVSLIAVFESTASSDDGASGGGDGDPSGSDAPADGDTTSGGDAPGRGGDPADSEDGGCNAAGPAIVELIILAGATLFCRRRPPASRQ